MSEEESGASVKSISILKEKAKETLDEANNINENGNKNGQEEEEASSSSSSEEKKKNGGGSEKVMMANGTEQQQKSNDEPPRTSRRKAPLKLREEMDSEEMEESEDEELNDVEEIKDDDDSDIMEVEAEDPLACSNKNTKSGGGKKKVPAASSASSSSSSSSSSATTSLSMSNSGSPNVVTIDDVKTLHKLANSAKRNNAANNDSNKPNLVLIDTNSILAGKSTSGVTITPARPKTNPTHSSSSPSLSSLPSGVTVSQNSSLSITKPSSNEMLAQSGFGYDKKGQLNDPNLTDDTFVVEAPSFIVPYVYEKPPKESFTEFRESIKKLIEERRKKEKEERKKRREEEAAEKRRKGDDEKSDEDDDDITDEDEKSRKEKQALIDELVTKKGKKRRRKDPEDPDYDSNMDEEEDSEEEGGVSKAKTETESSDSSDGIEEIKVERKSDSFFDSALGKFFSDLGMNLVQEMVQNDLLKQQIRKSQKDKSAGVMHAIMSLKKNLQASKESNEDYHFQLKKCRFCSFRTESDLVLANHLETPHMKNGFYRCNFCPYETKMPQDVLAHMMMNHGVRGKMERAPGIHQCPQCPFEDNMKGKLTRHKTGCDKRFRPERNQEPAYDWEPPAKIPKPPAMRGRVNPLTAYQTLPNAAAAAAAAMSPIRQPIIKSQTSLYSGMPQLQLGARGRGRPVGTYKGNQIMTPQQMRQGGFGQMGRQNPVMIGGQYMNNQVVLQSLNQGGRSQANNSVLLPQLGNSGSVTIQSINQRAGSRPGQPSISITPLPGRASNHIRPNSGAGSSSTLMKPGQPNAGQGKSNLVICEICDGFIKDLEQLRNHMQWIHKVKIHPKMIYNRPPLNCQKCQYRFFTDQGLERHLLGSHGLVTASMQDLANKGQDSGRCPVCGKVYQWKLLNHVAKDHQKTLKPAHLSYKCTVCTATFGQYKQFENHVYTAHSGAAKKADKNKQQQQATKSSVLKTTPTLSDEITIIPQKKLPAASSSTSSSSDKNKVVAKRPEVSKVKKPSKENDPDIIELDDEEEIDDVEESSNDTEVINIDTPAKKKKAAAAAAASSEDDAETDEDNSRSVTPSSSSVKRPTPSSKRDEPKSKQQRREESSAEEGVEEIEEDDDEEDQ